MDALSDTMFEYIIYYIAMYLFPFLKRNTLIWYDTMYVK